MMTTLYLLLSLLPLLSCGKRSNALSPDLAKAEGVMKEHPASAPEDWKELFQATDSAYPGFGHRLNERLLEPTTQELQICYLIKANVPPCLIAQLLNCSVTNISMTRKRLYEKTHGEKGTSAQFDQFIHKI